MRRLLIVFSSACLCLAPSVCLAQATAAATPRIQSPEYAQVQQRLSRGWNTWDVQSVTTHVLLPEGLSVRVGIHKKTRITGDGFLPTALIGRLDPDAEQVFPGPHAFDGSYTDLRLTWQGLSMRIQSATDAGDLVLLVSPLPGKPAMRRESDAGYRGVLGGISVEQAGHGGADCRSCCSARGQQDDSVLCGGAAGNGAGYSCDGSVSRGGSRDPAAFSSGKRRTVAEVQAFWSGREPPMNNRTRRRERALRSRMRSRRCWRGTRSTILKISA